LGEVRGFVMSRNRNRPTTSLQERLRKFAEEARAAASRAKPGREQDVLLQKARKAETTADAAHRLKA
jgi:hypothetical protein